MFDDGVTSRVDSVFDRQKCDVVQEEILIDEERSSSLKEPICIDFGEELERFSGQPGAPSQPEYRAFVAQYYEDLCQHYLNGQIHDFLYDFYYSYEHLSIESVFHRAQAALSVALDDYSKDKGDLRSFLDLRIKVGVWDAFLDREVVSDAPRNSSSILDSEPEIESRNHIPGEEQLYRALHRVFDRNPQWFRSFVCAQLLGMKRSAIAAQEGCLEPAICERIGKCRHAIESNVVVSDDFSYERLIGFEIDSFAINSSALDNLYNRYKAAFEVVDQFEQTRFPRPLNYEHLLDTLGLDPLKLAKLKEPKARWMVLEKFQEIVVVSMDRKSWLEYQQDNRDTVLYVYEPLVKYISKKISKETGFRKLHPVAKEAAVFVAAEIVDKLSSTYDPQNKPKRGKPYSLKAYISVNWKNRLNDYYDQQRVMKGLKGEYQNILYKAIVRAEQLLNHTISYRSINPAEVLPFFNEVLEERRQGSKSQYADRDYGPWELRRLSDFILEMEAHYPLSVEALSEGKDKSAQSHRSIELFSEADSAFIRKTISSRPRRMEHDVIPELTDRVPSLIDLAFNPLHKAVLEGFYIKKIKDRELQKQITSDESLADYLDNDPNVYQIKTWALRHITLRLENMGIHSLSELYDRFDRYNAPQPLPASDKTLFEDLSFGSRST